MSAQKILIALQMWEGDKLNALRLARLLADIEPGHQELADFLFVTRFDCSHDLSTIQHVSRKFNTFHYRSPKQGTGWPHGCNELWFGTMEWAYHMMEGKKIPPYKAVFTIESDGIPLVRDWIARYSRQWDSLNAMKKTFVAGAILNKGRIDEHINGQALFSGDLKFLRWLIREVGGAPARCGWDLYLAPSFRKWGWSELPGHRVYWNTPTFSEDWFNRDSKDGVVWVHGVKDSSLYTQVLKKLLNRTV